MRLNDLEVTKQAVAVEIATKPGQAIADRRNRRDLCVRKRLILVPMPVRLQRRIHGNGSAFARRFLIHPVRLRDQARDVRTQKRRLSAESQSFPAYERGQTEA